MGGGNSIAKHQQHVALRITPHTRTLRKARENVKFMVADEVSLPKIKNYFVRWARWWAKTVTLWDFQMLVQQFINMCWHARSATIAIDVLASYLIGLDSRANACDSILAA